MTAPIDYIGACFCGHQHSNMGYAPHPNKQVLWVCDDCLPYAKKVYHMPDKEFSIYEARALEQAGELAGGYLDTLGQTDLAELTADQWRAFLQKVVGAYAENIRAEVDMRNGGVPG